MKSKQLQQLTLVGLVFLLAAIAIVIREPSANQYEISLYGAYPGYFWLLVVGAMFVGAIVILGSARISKDRTWVFGALLLLLTNALVLLLPYIRGYMLYGTSDPLSHVGFVVDIINNGNISGNRYPPMHLLALTIADATGLEIMTIGLVLPVVFSVMCFGGMYYVLAYLFDSRKQVLFGLPFVLLPILGGAHVGFRPYDLSLMLVPILLYLFFKSQRMSTPAIRTMLVVALTAVMLYHPLTALFLVGVSLLYLAGRYVPQVHDQHDRPTGFVSLSAAIFLAWYTTMSGILIRFDSVYETLFGTEEGSAPVEGYTSAAEEASPALTDMLQTAIFQYGVDFVLFGLGYLFIGLAVLLLFQRRFVPTSYITMLGGTLLVFSLGGLAFLLMDMIVPHTRPFQLAKIAAVILAGQLFYLLIHRWNITQNRSTLRAGAQIVMVVTIALLIALSVMSLYPSPYGTSENYQVTEMEVTGSEWVIDHGNTEHQMTGLGTISHRRFHHALYGTNAPQSFERIGLPDHFNYIEHRYLSDSYQSNTYLTINEAGRIVYPEVFPDYRENWRFTPEDFEQLDRDRSTQRIYDNGDYDQYRIDVPSPGEED